VTIAGAGPTGALLALGLARRHCSVILQDPLSQEQIQARSRAYALTHSSRRLLERLDLWEPLAEHLIPFQALRLEDQELHRVVMFGPGDLGGANRGVAAIGWILDHQPLMALLFDRLRSEAAVELRLASQRSPDATGSSSADLEIACDGPRSPHRQRWRLPLWSHPYRQGCLTLKVRLRDAEATMAHELFRAEGPLAVLPLGDDRFQIVWSAPLERCRERALLPASKLLDQLATILPAGLEVEALLDQPSAIPLQLSLAPRLHRGACLLVGESGHRCHPVGGQGLNLCWRDVTTVLDLVERQCPAAAPARRIARRYSRQRLPDLILVGLATDGLVRLFSNRQPLLLALRRLSLSVLARSALLRRLSLAAMTDGPLTIG
jgi:2-octaprenyl-6-methoxyphenol hydroxylase